MLSSIKNQALKIITRCMPLAIYFSFTCCILSAHAQNNPPNTKKNIIFILIDTLRADHLGCYGYTKRTSPYIDKIAQQGIRFSRFYTVCPWTNPTIATLFTGRYPQAVFPAVKQAPSYTQVLPEELTTLAEILAKSGYNTIGMTDHPAISTSLNFDQGFNIFIKLYDQEKSNLAGTNISKITKEVTAQINRANETPFFLYVHLIYPHSPYSPPAKYKAAFAQNITFKNPKKNTPFNNYDAEIRYTDELIGYLFNFLERKNLLSKTYVLITSDHGEEFWEHGTFNHGKSLYHEVLNIPLIIYPPGGRSFEPAVINVPASNIDIFPTILELARVPDRPVTTGLTLTRFFSKKTREREKFFYSESPNIIKIYSVAYQAGAFKYIFDPETNTYEIYNVAKDPQELKNLWPKKKVPADIKKSIADHQRDNDVARTSINSTSVTLNEDSRERLKALGYIQ